MSGSSMRGGDPPTPADVEAVKAWTGLGTFDPLGEERVHRTYSDGRIVVRAASAEAAREVEEAARTHEERHSGSMAWFARLMCEALAQGCTVRPGPWASRNCATEKGREDLRRAGYEERHDGELGAIWVRPSDGETLKARESGFVVPVETDPGRERLG